MLVYYLFFVVCLSVYLSVCLSVCCLFVCCLFVCLYSCLSACLLSDCLFVCCLFVCLSVCLLSVCLLSVCLSVCLFVVYLSVCLAVCLFVCCLFVSLFICWSVCFFVCYLCVVCLFVFVYHFCFLLLTNVLFVCRFVHPYSGLNDENAPLSVALVTPDVKSACQEADKALRMVGKERQNLIRIISSDGEEMETEESKIANVLLSDDDEEIISNTVSIHL